MHRIMFYALIMMIAGCASPKLGDYYQVGTSDDNQTDVATIIIYIDEKIDDAIYFLADMDKYPTRRLFKGTFLKFSTPAGMHNIKVSEWLSGKGLSQALSLNSMFDDLFSEPESGYPPTLNAGASTSITFQSSANQIVFLRINKNQSNELFYQCNITDHSITMCSRLIYESQIEIIPNKEAKLALVNLQESMD